MGEPQGNAVAVPERLKHRADFLRAAKGKRFYAHGLTLQAAPRPMKAQPDPVNRRAPGDPKTTSAMAGSIQIENSPGAVPCMEAPPRFGFTVTKQSGGAVRRNRIRRRLKEALRLLKPLPARTGHDYVVLARPEALSMPFQALQAELRRALGKIDTRKTPLPIRPDHSRNDPISGGAGEESRKNSEGRIPQE